MRIVEEYEHFIEGARLDWLHPTNGRWPDLAVTVIDQHKDPYLAAVWWDGRTYTVMVEGSDRYHSIMQSYRWIPSGRANRNWWCRLDKSRAEEITVEGAQALRIRRLACASCYLFADLP